MRTLEGKCQLGLWDRGMVAFKKQEELILNDGIFDNARAVVGGRVNWTRKMIIRSYRVRCRTDLGKTKTEERIV